MKTYIVLTTINIPQIAIDLCKNIEKYKHKNDVGIIIIGDKKSPDKESTLIAKKLKKKSFDVEYFNLKRQKQILSKFPKFEKIIPYNSDNRRNIGFLLALKNGCEKVISIDDDNFPLNSVDFIENHSIVGRTQKLKVIKSSSNWFNPLSINKETKNIYTRGFPYNKREKEPKLIYKEKKIKIGINMGLWIGDPDVDAITRLNNIIKVKSKKIKNIYLEKGTYSPINTQNTAIVSELLPAYYFILMGEKIDGLVMERFGDIWSGFLVKKVSDHLNYHVSIGNPLVYHRRNKHNLFLDLKQELAAIFYTDQLSEIIEEISIKGSNAIDLYGNLCNQLLKKIQKDKRFSPDFKKYQNKLNYNQNIWLETIKKVQK